MNIPKQTQQAIILGVLVVVLGIVFYFSAKGSNPTPPPPPPPNSAAATSAADQRPAGPAKTRKAPEKLEWVLLKVKTGQIDTLVADAKGDRNPFQNLLPPPPQANAQPQTITPSNPIIPPGKDIAPLMPPMPIFTLMKTLVYTTVDAVKQAVEKAGLNVQVTAGMRPNQVRIKGTKPEYDEAVALMKTLETPPPPPPFVLTGIITTPTVRYAAITLGGKFYSLFEGESMPDTGWTVTRITPSEVSLMKKTQFMKLRLSGGKPL